jgi:hypothetical protein
MPAFRHKEAPPEAGRKVKSLVGIVTNVRQHGCDARVDGLEAAKYVDLNSSPAGHLSEDRAERRFDPKGSRPSVVDIVNGRRFCEMTSFHPALGVP